MALRRPMTARLADNPEVKIAHDASPPVFKMDHRQRLSNVLHFPRSPLPLAHQIAGNGVASDKYAQHQRQSRLPKLGAVHPINHPRFLAPIVPRAASPIITTRVPKCRQIRNDKPHCALAPAHQATHFSCTSSLAVHEVAPPCEKISTTSRARGPSFEAYVILMIPCREGQK